MIPFVVTVPLPFLLLASLAVVLVAVAYAHPPAAAYALVVATPLTAGLERGTLVPLLRPHEALGLILGAGVALRALALLRTGYRPALRLHRIDAAILLMAVTSSVLPLLWMAARGIHPTQDDLLYAATMWKFYGLFVLIRASVSTEAQVGRCLRLTVAAGAIVAIVAILQALQLAGVPELVRAVYPTEDPGGAVIGRGTSTLASSIAVGDIMAIHLVICLGWMLWRPRARWFLLPLAALFTLGALASGQFSGAIALGVAVLAVAVVTGHVRRVAAFLVPTVLAGGVILWPVVRARFTGFDTSTGLPQSWQVRLDNLRGYVWPELLSGQNWLFGVRPSARIRADVPWGPYIYIESGHTWLWWTGGVPFFLAFLYFVWVAVRFTASLARSRRDDIGVAALAAVAGLLVVFALMSLDPHLTMRGTADLLFSLLALATAVPETPFRPRPGDRRAAANVLLPTADARPPRPHDRDRPAGSAGRLGVRRE